MRTKLNPGFGSKRRKLVWRRLKRILGDDFFSATEMEFMFVKIHELIGFTDQMHLNSAGDEIPDCAMP